MLSNINACLAIQETIKTTLGPYGGDLLLVDANGRQTITNDGATVMKVPPLDFPPPILLPLKAQRASKLITTRLHSSSMLSTLPPGY